MWLALPRSAEELVARRCRPREVGEQQNGAASLKKNPPAVRQFTTMEAIKTGMLPLMWLSLGISAGVSLFGISYMVPFAKAAARRRAAELAVASRAGSHQRRPSRGSCREHR